MIEQKIWLTMRKCFMNKTQNINLIKKNEHALHIKCDDLMLCVSHFWSFVCVIRGHISPFVLATAILKNLCNRVTCKHLNSNNVSVSDNQYIQ